MADSVAALKVTLGLDAADYTRGLNKAEIQAKQFADATRTAIAGIGKVLGGLAIADLLYENAKAIAAEASALDQLASSTGSSVEELSKLNNVAKVAGVSASALEGILFNLGNSIGGTDKKSERAQRTLELLGVAAKDPATALGELGAKFNTYADGSNKAALATALFGGEAKAALAIFKTMAEQQQIGATITAEQAKQAAELETQMRLLSLESQKFARLVLNDVVPAVVEMVREFREGIQIAGGLFNALRLFGTLNPFDTPAEGISKLRKEIADLEAQRPKAGFFGKGELAEIDGLIADRRKQIQFLVAQAQGQFKANPEDTNVRDILQARKPQAPPPPPPSTRGGRSIKEQTDDAQKYLESLQQTQFATLELTETEKARLKIQDIEARTGRAIAENVKADILLTAEAIQATKDANKEKAEAAKLAAEEARIREQNSRAQTRQIEAAQKEAQTIRDGNEQLREQIIGIRGGQVALDEYAKTKLLAAAASKELEAAQIDNTTAGSLEAQAIREQAKALRERAGLIDEMRLAEKLRDEAKALQDVKNLFSDALVQPLTDFVTGAKSAKDAFKDLVSDITRQLARIASQNVANALFGGNTSGGADVFGVLAKLVGSWMAGGGVNFASYATGPGMPQLGGPGGMASGGVSRGGLTLVGEMGPELVHLPAGAKVTPNNQIHSKAGGRTVVVNQYIDRNADTRAHRQAALDAFNGASSAARRR